MILYAVVLVKRVPSNNKQAGGTSPTGAGASNQVKVFAWPGDMVKAVLVANLLHNILEDEEAGEAPNPAAVSSRVSEN